MDLRRAIANSCNVYFYQVGIRLEIARLAKWAKLMGLGAPTGIDLPHEVGGLMPSPEWKMRLFKTPWYAGETVSVAIGQGQVSRHPPADGPRRRGHRERGLPRPPPPRQGERPRDRSPWRRPSASASAPRRSPRSRRGCARWWPRARAGARGSPTVEVCGKTGSAQVVAKSRLAQSPNDFDDPPARLVPLLRARRRPEDRARRPRRARRQRRRVGGPRGARRSSPTSSGSTAPRGRPEPGPRTPRRRTSAVAGGIDRRLVYNVDWVLLGAHPRSHPRRGGDGLLRHPHRSQPRPLPEAARPRRGGDGRPRGGRRLRLPAAGRPRHAPLRPVGASPCSTSCALGRWSRARAGGS